MIIKWNQDWRLRSLKDQWVLEKRFGIRKKKRGNGKKPNWKGVYYYQDPLRALNFLVMNDILAIGGEYPASAFEPLIRGMNEIETRVKAFEKQIKSLLKEGHSGARVPLKEKSPKATSEEGPDPGSPHIDG